MNKFKKILAILLLITFVVSLNVSVVAALNPQPEPPLTVIGGHPPQWHPGTGIKTTSSINTNQISTSGSNSPFDYLLNIFKELLNTLFGNSDIKTEAKVIPFAPIER